ncbi:hypothetical protein K413DRAFT_1226 [Clostridium sp. ASBs410]|nr:hypothetical protein K413DRAFT_1226 [Clostridium sp. ASBs410]
MKVKALKTFSGAVSMYEGEVREIKDDYILNDLTRAGYIEPDAPKRNVKNNEGKRNKD